MDVLSNPVQSVPEKAGSNSPVQTTPPSDKPQWHMIDEEDPGIPTTLADLSQVDVFQLQDDRTKRGEKLQSEADSCLSDKDSLRDMIRSERFARGDSLTIKDWTKRPEEVSAMIILLNSQGRGLDQDRNLEKNTSTVIGTAFEVLKAGVAYGRYDDKFASWSAIDVPPRSDNAASKILDKLRTQVKEINQTDFDTCVMAALSCGDVMNALNLIKAADQFLPQQAGEARKNAVSRLISGGCFAKAYEIYPQSVKDRMDAVLASLGEGNLGDFSDMPPQVQELKNLSEQRLKTSLSKERDRWYSAQNVAKVNLREAQLDNTHLQDLVEQAIGNNKDWSEIQKSISEKASSVVDGEAANSIAAELIRRLHPELALRKQIEQIKAETRGEVYFGVNRPSYLPYSEYDSGSNTLIYPHAPTGSEITQNDKEGAVAKINTAEEIQEKALQDLYDPRRIGLRTLVSFLRNPDVFSRDIQDVINGRRPSRTLSYSESDDKQRNERLKYGGEILARKLSAGLDYLRGLNENIEMSRLLKQEFGFGEIVTPQNLTKAREALQRAFGDAVVVNSEQITEDIRVAGEMAQFIKTEKSKIADAKTSEARGVVKEMAGKAEEELMGLNSQSDKLSGLSAKQKELDAAIVSLGSQIGELDRPKSFGVGFLRISRPPSQEDMTKKAELAGQKTKTEEELAGIKAQIAEMGEVDNTRVQGLTVRKTRLESLIAA